MRFRVPCGAQLTGVDLRGPLDDQVVAPLIQALDEYAVVLLPGQQLEPRQQLALGEVLGKVQRQ